MAKAYRQIHFSSCRLSGRRLTLRPYKFADFAACRASFCARTSPRTRFDEPVAISACKSVAEFRKTVERMRDVADRGLHYIFGVFETRSGCFVGQVDLMVINAQLRWGNLGYQIHNQYSGRGYATEAAKLISKMAFAELQFHRLEAAMESANLASKKVAAKAGFRYEGLRRDFFPERPGLHLRVYGKSAFEFRKPRKK